MIELCRRYPLTVYFIIAYAGSWHAWALFLLSRNGSGFLPLHSPASFMVLMGLGTFSGPTIGAFIVTAATKGREGVVELLRRIVQWRVRVLWYVFAFLDLPVIQTLGAIAIPGVASTTTQSMSCLREWLRQRSSFFPRCLQVPWVRRSAGEELRFASSTRDSWASIGEFDPRYLVGLLAHAPIWFSGQWSEPNLLDVAAFVSWITAVSFIFTSVFNNTRASVFMAILLHAAMDVFPNVFLLVICRRREN